MSVTSRLQVLPVRYSLGVRYSLDARCSLGVPGSKDPDQTAQLSKKTWSRWAKPLRASGREASWKSRSLPCVLFQILSVAGDVALQG